MGLRDWGLLGLLALLWGGSFFFVEVALGGLPPLAVVWCRVAGAAVVLLVVLHLRGVALPSGWREWRAVAVMGVLNNALPFTFFALAQGRIGGGLAAILNAMTPMLTVVALFLLAGERAGAGRVAGVLAGFAGVAVMMGGAAEGELAAKLICLAAAGCYALASVWGRRRLAGIAPMAVAFGQCASAAVVLLPVAVWLRVWEGASADAAVWGAVAGLVLLSTALAYVIFFRLFAAVGPLNVQLVTFLIPLVAVGLGVAVLGERLEARHLGGAALIGLGLVAIDGRVRGLWRRVVSR
ncbi:MAG: ABC transporter permease [Rhodobacter sp. CACIA14H1]|nr:MAG: ABC transporter permease [Rhodobacter sp. CACIA14H1]